MKAYGPITQLQSQRRRIRYGPLTADQLDDLERISFLGSVVAFDLVGARRAEASVERTMGRYQTLGLVQRVGLGVWALSERGAVQLGHALAALDELVMTMEASGDEW